MQSAAIISVGVALLLSEPLHAAEQDAVRAAVAKGKYKPLTEILNEVASRHTGRVVDVETTRGLQGELRYALKLVDSQGRKQELLIDAATGNTVSTHTQDRSQALGLASLARYLAAISTTQRQGGHITDVEFERDAQGRGVYQIKLSAGPLGSSILTMDVNSGKIVRPPGAPHHKSDAAIKPLEEVLQHLSSRFNGLVLEVELEHDDALQPYYEVELLQSNGSTLELKVDARSLQVLKQKVED
ncbi:PepSY domain-containing protein [Diaphorobacter sp.]|uniref:PepSY domain-containing protein n=1 Tax=Diaphorobacter sp. TaxID=1934310 RepID=UPI0028A612A2|nr:PepSY domain-containing protein [Diaphorobacter sp.]